MSDLLQPMLSTPSLRALRVLEYVYDSPERSASRETSTRALEDDLGRDGVQNAIRDLVEGRLVNSERSLAGFSGAYITSAGEDVVERVRRARDSAARRNGALRDGLLSWIYSQGIDRPTYLDRFLESEHNQFHGAPFQKRELQSASRWLREKGYIRGEGSNGAGIPRPQITAEGIEIVEHDASVNDSSRSVPHQTFNTEIHGSSGNFALGSRDVNQSNSVTSGAAEAVAQTLAAVRQVLDVLVAQGADRGELERELDAAEATDVNADPGLVRDILTRIRGVFASGTAGAIGGALVAPIEQALAQLPG
ncbi:hypothetical protein [Sanguibacter sp. 25GB23B1]|uniref:hypothetical protein n=1 Tax=unclassified Sanguibacter TaxID=2645534 RepID=UPI0032AF21E0